MSDLKKNIEAVLFAAGRMVSLEEISKLTNHKDLEEIKRAVHSLKKELDDKDSPIMVLDEGNGWKLAVREKFLPTVQQIVPHTDISRPMLETLAVVAWKQPARQSEVVKYRGSTAYEHIHELERMGYIAREKQGRSYKVRVTNKFFEYFDLPKEKLKELLKDVKDVEEAQQKIAQFGGHIGHDHLGKMEVYSVTEAAAEEGRSLESYNVEKPVSEEREVSEEEPEEEKAVSMAKRIVEEDEAEEREEEKPVKKKEGRQLPKELEEELDEDES